MNLRNTKNYNIGLDLGTSSVGWAVTDDTGALLHFKGRPTWGSRLFSEGKTASETRIARGQRRRYDRRRQRLDLLQTFFYDEMEKIDSEFFLRLRQARLFPEDRDPSHADYRWPLFNESNFTEKDYYKRFPTIYHLRKHLMESDEKADIRLIYLAFHNIVKVRGNFLHQDNPNLSAKNANMKASIDRLSEVLRAWYDEREVACEFTPRDILAILEDQAADSFRSVKRDALKNAFTFDGDHGKIASELGKAFVGYKADFASIFLLESEKASFSLSNDEAVDEFISSQCPDEGADLFEALRAVHSAFVLSGILRGGNGETISFCKVNDYERYGNDLKLLKQLTREYAPEKYARFFCGTHYDAPFHKNYDASQAEGYTKYNLGQKKSEYKSSSMTYDDFKKAVEKLFKGTPAESDDRYKEMMQGFDEGTFLRRLKTSDNGSIPYQLHLEEMTAIIAKQAPHYPFLAENQQKIESLVSFRIPYYVGPLTTKNAAVDGNQNLRFAWAKRLPGKEGERIRPWNWDQIIDRTESAQRFIERMTGTCTYLHGEPVLPKCSLLYEKFCVLNELNGSRWSQDGDDEKRFSADDRSKIFELFKHGSVSYEKVQGWLRQNNRLNPHVMGGQGETKYESKLSSHMFFCRLLNVDDLDATASAMAEEIILWNTLFEDRKILKERIEQTYGGQLNSAQIKAICKKRFTGWGRLSKKLLCELKVPTDSGLKSIMDILEEGNPSNGHLGRAMVLMEVLRDDRLKFEQAIDAANKEALQSGGGLKVEDLPGSPALRRTINQAVRVVEEIASITKKVPANIFIEVTREDDGKKKGKRTTRRYDTIKQALKSLRAEGEDKPEILSELGRRKPDELDEKLTLYFMQNGKSLYSGEPLRIECLSEYQVDHIIPQSYYKDDSFENKALVLPGENQRKSNALLVEQSIRTRMEPFWRTLRNHELIGEKKYRNLMRDRVDENQMKGFINRQLVETSQIVKFTQMILSDRFPETKIIPVKAALSSQVRSACGFVKCREANDYHHAHDAYLACEIGRFIQLRHPDIYDNPIAYTRMMRDFVRARSEELKRTGRMPGDATFLVQSFLRSGFNRETGEIFKDAWDAEAEIARIRRFLNYKDCYISRMPEIHTGAFWGQTIYSPHSNETKLLSLKKGLNTEKYGGYSNKAFAYFFIYSGVKGRSKKYAIAGLPIYLAKTVAEDEGNLLQYAQALGAEKEVSDIEIVASPILYNQVVRYQKDEFRISAEDVVYSNRQLFLPTAYSKHLAALGDNAISEGDGPLYDELYSVIIDKMDVLCTRFERIKQTLVNGKNEFLNFEVSEKKEFIKQLCAFCNGGTERRKKARINISRFGGSPNAGGMGNGFILSSISELEIIDQSVTGMFESRRRLEL